MLGSQEAEKQSVLTKHEGFELPRGPDTTTSNTYLETSKALSISSHETKIEHLSICLAVVALQVGFEQRVSSHYLRTTELRESDF